MDTSSILRIQANLGHLGVDRYLNVGVAEYLGEITQYNLKSSDCIEKDSQITSVLTLTI